MTFHSLIDLILKFTVWRVVFHAWFPLSSPHCGLFLYLSSEIPYGHHLHKENSPYDQ